MTQEDLKEFKRYNDQLYQLITSATQSYLLARTLSDVNENECSLDIKFIMYHEHLYIKNTVIDLYKILSNNKNERYNIFKYLNKIELNKKYFNITIEQIKAWKENIERHQSKATIITNLRSKYYAHIDSDHSEYLKIARDVISWDDYENIFCDLQDFYIESNLILYREITGFKVSIAVEYFKSILTTFQNKL